MTHALARSIRSSLVYKVLATCFAATHVPLLAIVIYVVLVDRQEVNAVGVLAVTLGATLVGTACALLALRWFVRPVDEILASIEQYRVTATVPAAGGPGGDDLARLRRGVRTLIVDLDRSLSKLKLQALSDPLTGVGNRRWLMEIGNLELERARRRGVPLGILLLDLDRFKQINDRHGHARGDEALIGVAQIMRETVRPYDHIARLGGEEFCVLLAEADLAIARDIAERLRKAIAAAPVAGFDPGAVTASIGLQVALPADPRSLREQIAEADRQLYRAKALGRNCVAAGGVPA